MNTLIPQFKKLTPLHLIVFAVGSFAFCPQMQSATETPDPPPLPGSNTADGFNALSGLTTGIHNSAFGWSSLSSNGAANFNTGVGSGTLLANTADENTAVGAGALSSNTAGFNTATGAFALFANSTGENNTAVGDRALQNNATGSFHTAVGWNALQNCIAPPDFAGNTAVGEQALLSDTTGNFNTAVGAEALALNTTGAVNTAIGLDALVSNTTGDSNTATGGNAMFSNTTGTQNTATGIFALFSNTAGNLNTAVGLNALNANLMGSSNTAVGSSALLPSTGNGNTALGAGAGSGVSSANNVICIGSPGANTADNTCFIGNITGTAVVGDAVVVATNGQLGTVASAARFKKKIRPMDKSSEGILALKPVTFQYKSDNRGMPQFGLIAEEVAKVNPDLVVRDRKGEIYSVRYEAVNAMLLNEFLKEHRKVEQLEEQVEKLAAGLQKVSAQLEVSKPAPQTVLNNQ